VFEYYLSPATCQNFSYANGIHVHTIILRNYRVCSIEFIDSQSCRTTKTDRRQYYWSLIKNETDEAINSGLYLFYSKDQKILAYTFHERTHYINMLNELESLKFKRTYFSFSDKSPFWQLPPPYEKSKRLIRIYKSQSTVISIENTSGYGSNPTVNNYDFFIWDRYQFERNDPYQLNSPAKN
jgi:hypothetical protein